MPTVTGATELEDGNGYSAIRGYKLMTVSNTTNPTISEIAAGSLAAVRVFEKYGIDYCCGGKQPVEQACAALGLDSESVQRDLDAALAGPASNDTEWNKARLSDLIRHIVSTHHAYLKQELPNLAQRLGKVMKVYGEQDRDTLTTLPAIFSRLASELDMHLHKEEMILFPYIERAEAQLLAGRPLPPVPFGSVANPIAMMEHEHDDAGEALGAMRALTRDYAIPECACVTYRSLLNGLRELEADLHLHIHLENNILFPRALALEGAGSRL